MAGGGFSERHEIAARNLKSTVDSKWPGTRLRDRASGFPGDPETRRFRKALGHRRSAKSPMTMFAFVWSNCSQASGAFFQGRRASRNLAGHALCRARRSSFNERCSTVARPSPRNAPLGMSTNLPLLTSVLQFGEPLVHCDPPTINLLLANPLHIVGSICFARNSDTRAS